MAMRIAFVYPDLEPKVIDWSEYFYYGADPIHYHS